MRKLALVLGAAALVATTLGATVSTAAAAKPDRGPTIVDLAVDVSGGVALDDDHTDFDILIQAVLATGLDGFLSGNRQLTVFAPVDQAFLDLTGTSTEADALAATVGLLGIDGVRDVVSYHVAPGQRLSGDVVDSTRIRTVTKSFITKQAGSTVLTDAEGNDVQIIGIDNLARNGVVHVIDSVLMP